MVVRVALAGIVAVVLTFGRVEPAAPSPEASGDDSTTGAVLAHGGGPLRASIIAAFWDLCPAGKRLVLIPTAIGTADRQAYRDKIAKLWRRHGFVPTVLHARTRAAAEDPALARKLVDADCAWIGGGAQGRLESFYVGTPVETELMRLRARGGAIGGYSAGAAFLSRVMIRRGRDAPEEGVGLGAVPGVVIDQHFVTADREPRLLSMLASRRDLLGYGIDEETALVVHRGRARVIGRSIVRVCSHARGCRTLQPGDERDLLRPP